MKTQFSVRLARLVAILAAALVSPGLAQGQPAGITPEMVQRAMEDQHAKLAAQCPAPPPRVPEGDEGKYPIHVERWGHEGPQILLVHGGVQGKIGGGPKTFDRQKALAEHGFVVESVTRPGFGPGSPSRGPDDMAPDARAIAQLIRPGANVIAHSWGGAEALLAVALHPERVRSLILIEPAIAPTIGGTGVLSDPVVMADLRKRTLTQLSAKTPADMARAFSSMMGDFGGIDAPGPKLSTMSDADVAEFGCNGLAAKMASNDEVLAAIERVKKAHIPVLLVTGGWSPSIDATGEVVARLAGGRHTIVKSPNHFVQFSNAEDFNKVALAFIRSSDERSPK